MSSPQPTPNLWTPRALASYLGVTESTLYLWRRDKKGPPYIKLENGQVRYRDDAVQEWITLEGRSVA